MINCRVCRSLFLLLCILGGSANQAWSQRPRALAPDVETVVTDGIWQSKGLNGRFRAVIRTVGTEHRISRITVDWIADATESDTAKIVASTTLETGPTVLIEPQFEPVAGAWVLWVTAADTHTDPPERHRWRIELVAPGEVRARQVAP